MSDQANDANRRVAKIIGATMLIVPLLVVLTMGHHPSGAHGQGGLARVVHGAMLLFLGLLYGSFAWAFGRDAFERTLSLFGLVAYSISLLAHVGAATVNGFVVPALAKNGADAVSHDIFLLCWEMNQALAGLGVYATGIAYGLWGLYLLRTRMTPLKLIGGLGVIAGMVPIILLGFDIVSMNVSGAMWVYGLHMIWPIFLGTAIYRGRFN